MENFGSHAINMGKKKKDMQVLKFNFYRIKKGFFSTKVGL